MQEKSIILEFRLLGAGEEGVGLKVKAWGKAFRSNSRSSVIKYC